MGSTIAQQQAGAALQDALRVLRSVDLRVEGWVSVGEEAAAGSVVLIFRHDADVRDLAELV